MIKYYHFDRSQSHNTFPLSSCAPCATLWWPLSLFGNISKLTTLYLTNGSSCMQWRNFGMGYWLPPLFHLHHISYGHRTAGSRFFFSHTEFPSGMSLLKVFKRLTSPRSYYRSSISLAIIAWYILGSVSPMFFASSTSTTFEENPPLHLQVLFCFLYPQNASYSKLPFLSFCQHKSMVLVRMFLAPFRSFSEAGPGETASSFGSGAPIGGAGESSNGDGVGAFRFFLFRGLLFWLAGRRCWNPRCSWDVRRMHWSWWDLLKYYTRNTAGKAATVHCTRWWWIIANQTLTLSSVRHFAPPPKGVGCLPSAYLFPHVLSSLPGPTLLVIIIIFLSNSPDASTCHRAWLL